MPTPKIAHAFLIFFLFIALEGCVIFSRPVRQFAPPPLPSWQARAATLNTIKNWDLQARLAIRNQTKTRAESVNLIWRQSHSAYTIILFGPLGTHVVKLSGKTGRALLEKANGARFTAVSPEKMLVLQTGWNLPVANLYYWARGLPAPGTTSQLRFDKRHHILELIQQGWTVNYLDYTTVNHIDLPNKIFLGNKDFAIKIIIKHWRISH